MDRNMARRVRLFCTWLGEAVRDAAAMLLVFMPLEKQFTREVYTFGNIILWLTAILTLFGFGVIIGFIGELEKDE